MEEPDEPITRNRLDASDSARDLIATGIHKLGAKTLYLEAASKSHQVGPESET